MRICIYTHLIAKKIFCRTFDIRLENVIIIEDYVKTDNAFYLEVSFKELLKISNLKVIEGVEEQSDLPKLK